MLPKYFTNEIPNTTSHYWKQENHQKYIGTEFVQDVRTSLDETKLFLDKRLVFAKKTFVQFARFYLIILNMIDREVLKKKIKEHRNTIFNQFEKLAEDFPIDKSQLLRFIKISKHQYQSWLSDRKYICTKSLINQCFKRRPNQISLKEINTLKRYMNHKRYKIWCIRSVWGKAVRDGAVSMAESTWYKYTRKLGYSKARKPAKKNCKKGSYDANKPNETWHMDISQYKTFDNITFYIYTVVDNFSRKILTYDISKRKCSVIRTNTLKEAIRNEFKINIESSKNQNKNLDLIVDGGTENNNKTVHEFLKTVK